MAAKRSLQQTPHKPSSTLTPSNSLRKQLSISAYTKHSPMLGSPFDHPESKAGNEEGLKLLDSFFTIGSSTADVEIESPTVKTSATKQPTPPASPPHQHDQVFDNIVAGRCIDTMDEPAVKKQKLSTPGMTERDRLHRDAGLQMSPLNDNPGRVGRAIKAVYELKNLVDGHLTSAWEQVALFRRAVVTFNADLDLSDFDRRKDAMLAMIPKLDTHYPMPHDIEARITAAVIDIQEACSKLDKYIDACARDITRLLEEAIYPGEREKHLSFWYTTVGDNDDYASLHKLITAYRGCLTKSETFKALPEAKGIAAGHDRLKASIGHNHRLCLSMPGDIIDKYGITGAGPSKGYKHHDVQAHLNNYNKLFKKTTRELVRAVTFLRNFILVNEGAQARFHVDFPSQPIRIDSSLFDTCIAYGTPLAFASELQAAFDRHLQQMKLIHDTQAFALAHADELEKDDEDQRMNDADVEDNDASEEHPVVQLPTEAESEIHNMSLDVAPSNEHQIIAKDTNQIIGGAENEPPAHENDQTIAKKPATKTKAKAKVKKAGVEAAAAVLFALSAKQPEDVPVVKSVKEVGYQRVGKRELDGLVMVDNFDNEPRGRRRPPPPHFMVPAKKAAAKKQAPATKKA